MGKEYRGKRLWKLPARGRGTCPICKTTRIKILHDLLLGNGKTIKVCKRCQHKKIDSIDSDK